MINTETLDTKYFTGLWGTRQHCRLDHSPEAWDDRAERWIDDLGADGRGKIGMNERIDHTARYLISRGALNAETTVIDVGCGPGLFVMEFAKTARHAVGIDHSKRFIDYAKTCANSRNLHNASFLEDDFLYLDIDKAGYSGAFDLVFASITPAVTGEGGIVKFLKMSRGFCNNVSFVNVSDTLAERVSLDVFGEKYKPRFDGTGFYALLNLLWLDGYYPETSYYTDSRMEVITPSEENAADFATLCGRFESEDAAKVMRYLEKHGDIERQSEYCYGSILWSVLEKRV